MDITTETTETTENKPNVFNISVQNSLEKVFKIFDEDNMFVEKSLIIFELVCIPNIKRLFSLVR